MAQEPLFFDSKGNLSISSFSSQNSKPSKRFWYVFWLIAVVGTGLRIAACDTDFWLDEIWSLFNSRFVLTPIDILASQKLKIDNNHFLNTLWMWLLGDQVPWIYYRIPSLVSGVLSIGVAAMIGLRRNEQSGLMTAALVSFSYVFIHYSSEARGYGTLVFFCICAIYFFEGYLNSKKISWAFCFSVFAGLGLLSHLAFLHAYFSFLLVSSISLLKNFSNFRKELIGATACHLLPSLILSVVYFLFISEMRIGGGNAHDLFETVLQSMQFAVGFPSMFGVIGSAFALFFSIWAIRQCKIEDGDIWVLYLATIFVIPAALLVAKPPSVIFVRYFIVPITFFIVVLGVHLPSLLRSNFGGRVAFYVFFAIFLGGSFWNTYHLIKVGRGQYLAALKYLESETAGRTISIATDHHFRNGILIEYYRQFLKSKNIVFSEKPEWVVLHTFDEKIPSDSMVSARFSTTLRFAKRFGYSGLSGWNWILYRKIKD